MGRAATQTSSARRIPDAAGRLEARGPGLPGLDVAGRGKVVGPVDSHEGSERSQDSVPPDFGLSISHAAVLVKTTVRALRYYEERGLLSPQRTSGARRSFCLLQLDRARIIVVLRRLGVGIAEIASLIDRRDMDGQTLAAMVRSRVVDLEHQQSALRGLLASLEEEA